MYVLITYWRNDNQILYCNLIGKYNTIEEAYYLIDIAALKTNKELSYILFYTDNENVDSYYKAIALRCPYAKYRIDPCKITLISKFGGIFLEHVIFPRLYYYNSYKKLLDMLSRQELNTHYINITGKKPPFLNRNKKKELLKSKFNELIK